MKIIFNHLFQEMKIITTFLIITFFCLYILPVQAEDKKISDLKKFYLNNCVKCHGPDGSAIARN